MRVFAFSRGDATHQRHLLGKMQLTDQSNSPAPVSVANPLVYCQRMNSLTSNACDKKNELVNVLSVDLF